MVLDRLFLWIFTIAVIGKFSFPFAVIKLVHGVIGRTQNLLPA